MEFETCGRRTQLCNANLYGIYNAKRTPSRWNGSIISTSSISTCGTGMPRLCTSLWTRNYCSSVILCATEQDQNPRCRPCWLVDLTLIRDIQQLCMTSFVPRWAQAVGEGCVEDISYAEASIHVMAPCTGSPMHKGPASVCAVQNLPPIQSGGWIIGLHLL